jgi:hypothetical protein
MMHVAKLTTQEVRLQVIVSARPPSHSSSAHFCGRPAAFESFSHKMPSLMRSP